MTVDAPAALLDEVAVAPLDADDRSSLADELARADDLRGTMAGAQ